MDVPCGDSRALFDFLHTGPVVHATPPAASKSAISVTSNPDSFSPGRRPTGSITFAVLFLGTALFFGAGKSSTFG